MRPPCVTRPGMRNASHAAKTPGHHHYRQGAVKVRRHSPGLGPRVRVRPWAFDERVVHLALADQAIVPHPEELEQWVETLIDTRPRLSTIRTGALFPAAAARFVDAGFVTVDTLALLRVELAGRTVVAPPATSRLLGRRHHDASLVDRAAFGDNWANDARDLADIRHATPSHRARGRFVRRGAGEPGKRRRLVGFAISGAAGGQGYLQRLAVVPEHQREGHGRALALDALAWMRRRRLSHGVVNTAVTNAPALNLYESLGFRRLAEELLVMQLDITTR